MPTKPRQRSRAPVVVLSATPVFRVVVMATVAVVTVATWLPLADAYGVPKLVALALGVGTAAVVVAVTAARSATFAVRRSAALVAMGAFVAMALLTTVLSDDGWRSFVGQRSRWTGSATYVLAGVLGLLVA